MNYNVISIIDPREVQEIAFADVGSVPDRMVGVSNIEYAINRFIAPVVGHRLLKEISAGEYEYLRINFVQGAIAFYVRYISGFDAESNGKMMLARARFYLKELSDYLEEESCEYEEYDGGENILNRCRIYGDLVQIL